MGEVYRARDTTLGRDVALKLLPEHSPTTERLARFQREAQVLASLNHPHIAQIYGLEDSGDLRALVMELVEGSTLADRIARGPLPLNEALTIASQIAEAVEAAHDKGITHRDLKPANVKVTPDGVVKVLDFGLAAVAQGAGRVGGRRDALADDDDGCDRAGVILGTAAYMSPEQAVGKAVDKRADIWSFGVVLWEMLTGARLFDGETVSHTLADVLRAEIDFDKLPRDTPPAIREMLRRCLDRDPRKRLRDIGEARIAIKRFWPMPEVPSGTAPSPSVAHIVANVCRRLWRGRGRRRVCRGAGVRALPRAAGGRRTGPLPDRASRPDDVRKYGGVVARRPPDGVRSAGAGWSHAPVGAFARHARRTALAGHRRRGRSFLVSGQPVPCLRGERISGPTEKGGFVRRPAANAVRVHRGDFARAPGTARASSSSAPERPACGGCPTPAARRRSSPEWTRPGGKSSTPGPHSCPMDDVSSTTACRASRRTAASISDRSTRSRKTRAAHGSWPPTRTRFTCPSTSSGGSLLFLREGTLLVQSFDGQSH